MKYWLVRNRTKNTYIQMIIFISKIVIVIAAAVCISPQIGPFVLQPGGPSPLDCSVGLRPATEATWFPASLRLCPLVCGRPLMFLREARRGPQAVVACGDGVYGAATRIK